MEDISTAPLEHYLRTLAELKGSDLLLVVGAPPTIRVDGELRPIEGEPVLTPAFNDDLVHAALGPELSLRLKEERDIDFSFGWEDHARVRGNAFYQRGTVGLALRLIPSDIPSFAELGLPPIVEELANATHGLVLVTGPTGSGKTTTLAAMVKYISLHRACHILTIEDPIEFHHAHSRSIVTQREVGSDSESFARALRSALREDPDVLLVGEMRDMESIQAALNIAETGHLVLATLHTNDAAQAVNRIVDVFPPESQAQIRVQVAASLVGVIAQRLLPRIDGGRVAAFEILMATPAVRTLIRDSKAEQLTNVISTGQRQGMVSLAASTQKLVEAGIVAPI
ncbi:MAG: type pilus assembly protein PilT [Actinomycetia bacterium]|nr:type pilus assembly protein PilT [Actinomycetes bacterium]